MAVRAERLSGHFLMHCGRAKAMADRRTAQISRKGRWGLAGARKTQRAQEGGWGHSRQLEGQTQRQVTFPLIASLDRSLSCDIIVFCWSGPIKVWCSGWGRRCLPLYPVIYSLMIGGSTMLTFDNYRGCSNQSMARAAAGFKPVSPYCECPSHLRFCVCLLLKSH